MTGRDGFVVALREEGLEPTETDGVVTFTVVPVTGTLSGKAVSCGVAAEELSSWPTVPPHWLHVESSIRFPQTNAQPSPVPGWSRHSRPASGWGNDEVKIRAYLAHARSVLGEAA